MPLLLMDLDDTLVDRAAAFRRWAATFVLARHGMGSRSVRSAGDDVAWLVQADDDGEKPREQLAAEIAERFELPAARQVDLAGELRLGLVAALSPDQRLLAALRQARSAGWATVVITNGGTEQQRRKLARAGLDQVAAACVISEEAGVAKPDPLIFQLAAERAGQSLVSAWMIGDRAETDIAGAHAVGLPSVWLHRGRPWPGTDFTPTRVAASCLQAIRLATTR